jgi:hypothetical protein
MFYPADPAWCRALAKELTTVSFTAGQGASDAVETTRMPAADRGWLGGVVPHAGWNFSGAIAGLTIATIARGRPEVDLVVVFGAIHTPLPTSSSAVLDSFQRWDVPGSDTCQVDAELRQRLGEMPDRLCITDNRFHWREHAVEVELPLVRSVWPRAAILPVEIPPNQKASEVGRRTAQLVARANLKAVYLASSDLTHYGPAYGFTPAGVGTDALQWAKENDRSVVDLVLARRDEAIVPEVLLHRNACGAGAIAAMLAACNEQGAGDARLLRHATSFETGTAAGLVQRPDNAVGYASIVVG